jgi:hypothetical protein
MDEQPEADSPGQTRTGVTLARYQVEWAGRFAGLSRCLSRKPMKPKTVPA